MSASPSVFDYQNCRKFLVAALPVSGPGRGARNRLAEALNCQKSFISQVLSGKAGHFSLEQGLKIGRFLGLSSEEMDYFLLLLNQERAGSKDLAGFFSAKVRERQTERQQIKTRIRARTDFSPEELSIYCSSWLYAAAHTSLMIPGIYSRTRLATFLGVTIAALEPIVTFLLATGLAVESNGRLSAGTVRIHFPHPSPQLLQHHSNWRLRAVSSLDDVRETDLHYSAALTLDAAAAEKIRKILLEAIQQTETALKDAPEETVYALNLDLFSLQKARRLD